MAAEIPPSRLAWLGAPVTDTYTLCMSESSKPVPDGTTTLTVPGAGQ
jgi:hypothetical protein